MTNDDLKLQIVATKLIYKEDKNMFTNLEYATNTILDACTNPGIYIYPSAAYPPFDVDVILKNITENSKKKTLADDISHFKIYKDSKTNKDRVVMVYFKDGSFTKCEVDKDRDFDLYTGIAFCLFKKNLGVDGHKCFNKMMKDAMKAYDNQIKNEEAAEKKKELAAEKKRKIKLKKAAKLLKARQAVVDCQRDAIVQALHEYDRERKNGEDDLK